MTVMESFIYIIFKILFYVYGYFICMYVCVSCPYVELTGTKEGIKASATEITVVSLMWEMGIELRSYGRIEHPPAPEITS